MSELKTFELNDATADDFVKSINAAVKSGFPNANKAVFKSRINNTILFSADTASGDAVCRQFNAIKEIGEVKSDKKVSFDGRTLVIPKPKNTIVLGAAASIFGSDKVSRDPRTGDIIISSPKNSDIVALNSSLTRYGELISGLSDVVAELSVNPVIESQSLVKMYYSRNGIMLDMRGHNNPIPLLNIVEECFPSTSYNFVPGYPSHEIIKRQAVSGDIPVIQCMLLGDRNDFYRFLKVCESNGYNTEQTRKFVEEKISERIIPYARADGEVDLPGGESQLNDEINKVESNFAEHLLKTRKQAGVKIKDKQAEGMKFLFTRESAILGDEPGVGKSLQLIGAAHIRLNASGGRCVIITKNIVVKQLEKEIIGMTKNDSVSTDYNSNAQWLVLPYSIFGNDRIRETVTKRLMEEAKAGKITVMILDESHTIKNGDPSDRDPSGGMSHKAQNTTFNIQDITKYVPFVWGASATIVANTADDVYNQLKAVNHPIGNMDFNKFKSRFTHPKSQELRLERADELRQSLIDHGVYIQRSKKQVEPNLPELNTTQNNVPVTNGQIKTLAQEKSGSSPPNIMHERMAVADLKTDQSVAKAAGILQTGKKVAIFTGFRSSRQLLVNKLQSVLERLKMNKTVFTIDGDQNSEEREIVVSSFKDPDSPVMAIVINLQAGGTGVDFPNILTDVIINDFDWAPSTDTQSINRFFRISSKQDVNVSYMVANGTVDEEIFKRLQLKKQIADAIAILNDEESRLISEKRGSMDAQLRQTRENRRKLMIALANEEATDKDTFKI